ncbi:phage scaffolding protein [Bacillus sp. JJ722]|uniref:phage scaffolding protein n=1 Tax=Bacillus sp. JJ722 TaxID=3122973 RepID=UPI002FFF6EF8
MNKEQLVAIGLTEEQADKVIAGFGTMIPKSRLDDKIQEAKDLKIELDKRDGQLAELKKIDVDGLKTKIDELQSTNETTKIEYEGKLQAKDFNFALERALHDAKAKNPKAVRALLNTEAITLDGENLLGLSDQLEKLKETEDYLFESDNLSGRTPPAVPPRVPGSYDKANPWKQGSINLTEQGRILRENPELAKTLMTQAK